jgi:hydrogenase nickel incorporation protein HypB
VAVKVPVLKDITEANTLLANELRDSFRQNDVLVLDVVASPGAGKTTLLERTIERLNGELRLCVIEGDPATSLDAERVAAVGVPAVQINTGGGCHLEARMVQAALDQLDMAHADVVIIENVGNLLCPTGWDLGEDAKVLVASLPEGDDKPLKYPMSFASAQVVVINKIDLEPYIRPRSPSCERMRCSSTPPSPYSRYPASPGKGSMRGWTGYARGWRTSANCQPQGRERCTKCQ